MLFTFEVNKLMLIDGILFIIPGINIMLFPNPQRSLGSKLESKTALPLFIDIRRILGATYAAMGLMIAAMGGIISRTDELNKFAIFRSASLVFIVIAIGLQLARNKWKRKRVILMYLLLYSLLMVLYFLLGVIDPLPLQA